MSTYSPAERTEALAAYAAHGPCAAARTLGIPKGTIARWATAAGLSGSTRTQRMGAANAARREAWTERRLDLADQLGDLAQKALDATNRHLDAGEASDAKSTVTTMAIAVDKAELLTGGATARVANAYDSETDRQLAQKLQAYLAGRERVVELLPGQRPPEPTRARLMRGNAVTELPSSASPDAVRIDSRGARINGP